MPVAVVLRCMLDFDVIWFNMPSCTVTDPRHRCKNIGEKNKKMLKNVNI